MDADSLSPLILKAQNFENTGLDLLGGQTNQARGQGNPALVHLIGSQFGGIEAILDPNGQKLSTRALQTLALEFKLGCPE